MNLNQPVRAVEYREYDTPEGYVHAIRQLSTRGYNYFLPVKTTRRRSAMIIGKAAQPRKADRTLQ